MTVLGNEDNLRQVGIGAKDFLYISWEEIAAQAYGKYEEIVSRFKFRQIQGIIDQRK